MRKYNLISILLVASLLSCKNDDEDKINPYGSGNGQVAFWASSTFNVGSIDVLVDNVTIGTITQYHPGGITCDLANVKKAIAKGTHTWQLIAQSGYTANGNLTVKEGECTLIELPAPNNFLPRIDAKFGADSVKLQGNQIQIISKFIGDFSQCDNSYSIFTQKPITGAYYLPRILIGKPQAISIVGEYKVTNTYNDFQACQSRVTAADWSGGMGVATENTPPYNQGLLKITFYDPASRRISGEFRYLLNSNVPFSGKFYNLVFE